MSSSALSATRRAQMLAALDIDVWQVRDASSLVAQTGSVAQAAGSSGSSAASAALALLEEAQDRAVASRSLEAPTADSARGSKTAGETVPLPEKSQGTPVVDTSLSLFCLSGPHGVLLANLTGLSPQGQRVLGDIFQATMRIVASERSNKKLKVQKLNFNWPPLDGAAELQSGAPTGRALRGFLTRQLTDKPTPVILYAAQELKELLENTQLEVDAKRVLYIGEPEALLIDGEAKRALWQTLNTL